MTRSLLAVLLSSVLLVPAVAALAVEPILTPQNRPEAFRQLDVDGDGWISRQEADVHPEVAANFAKSDADNDGRLSLSEFETVPLNRSDQPGAFQTPERG